MKKTFKRAGVAVLSMAMLLSMGAVGAMTASAAPDDTTYSVTITDAKKFGYSYSKIADLDENGITYTVASGWDGAVKVESNYLTQKSAATGTEAKFSENTTADQKKKLADALAGVSASFTAVANDTITGLTPGYYVFKSSSSGAQNILVEVKGDIVAGQLRAKANEVTIDKTITSITDANTSEAAASLVQSGGKNGHVSVGSTVQYNITTAFPYYDTENVTAATNITDFTITDIPEAGLTITPNDVVSITAGGTALVKDTDYTVVSASDAKIKATDNTENKNYFEGKAEDTYKVAGTGVKITFTDSTVINKRGAEVVVTLNALVNANASVNSDTNRNCATVEYNNDYFTGGQPDEPVNPTTGDPNEPDEPTDHESSYADVYCTLFTVNKKDNSNQSLKGAVFALYKGTDTTGSPIATLGSTDSTSADYTDTFVFSGLNVGTYTLVEQSTPNSSYVKADNVTFEVKDDTFAGSYTFTNKADNSAIANGSLDIVNISGQSLPGTGGMGTVLFTVGGAAIVLLAGALFVVYMRKRKVEE